MYVYINVCMHVYMYVCTYVCIYANKYACVNFGVRTNIVIIGAICITVVFPKSIPIESEIPFNCSWSSCFITYL